MDALPVEPYELCPTVVPVTLALALDDVADGVVLVLLLVLLLAPTMYIMSGQSGAVSTWP